MHMMLKAHIYTAINSPTSKLFRNFYSKLPQMLETFS